MGFQERCALLLLSGRVLLGLHAKLCRKLDKLTIKLVPEQSLFLEKKVKADQFYNLNEYTYNTL
jgi:hypothetical protein